MGFLNPKYPLPGESGGAVQLGRDVTLTTLVQIKLVIVASNERLGYLSQYLTWADATFPLSPPFLFSHR